MRPDGERFVFWKKKNSQPQAYLYLNDVTPTIVAAAATETNSQPTAIEASGQVLNAGAHEFIQYFAETSFWDAKTLGIVDDAKLAREVVRALTQLFPDLVFEVAQVEALYARLHQTNMHDESVDYKQAKVLQLARDLGITLSESVPRQMSEREEFVKKFIRFVVAHDLHLSPSGSNFSELSQAIYGKLQQLLPDEVTLPQVRNEVEAVFSEMIIFDYQTLRNELLVLANKIGVTMK